MPTVRVIDLISRAQTLTKDYPSVRWPVLELQQWLNDAYREIINIRPDANSMTGTYTCGTGTRQILTTSFPTAIKLIDVPRNLSASSDKRAIRQIERRQLDDQRRGWHAEDATVNIEHFMFDPRLPKEFLVYPPATSGAQLEVVYSSVPVAHALTETQLNNTATTEVIRIDDTYANAILDYMLYRAYSKDADYAANADRANGYRQSMVESLGAKSVSDGAYQPGGKAG